MGIIIVISVVRLLGNFINQYVLVLGANLDSLLFLNSAISIYQQLLLTMS